MPQTHGSRSQIQHSGIIALMHNIWPASDSLLRKNAAKQRCSLLHDRVVSLILRLFVAHVCRPPFISQKRS